MQPLIAFHSETDRNYGPEFTGDNDKNKGEKS